MDTISKALFVTLSSMFLLSCGIEHNPKYSTLFSTPLESYYSNRVYDMSDKDDVKFNTSNHFIHIYDHVITIEYDTSHIYYEIVKIPRFRNMFNTSREYRVMVRSEELYYMFSIVRVYNGKMARLDKATLDLSFSDYLTFEHLIKI